MASIKIEIIPAIDLLHFKPVRLLNGDIDKAVFYPLSVLDYVSKLVGLGCKRLHLVNLDSAFGFNNSNQSLLEELKNIPDLFIDYSGGIKTLDSAECLLNDLNCNRIILGSIIFNNKIEFSKIINKYDLNRIGLALDVRDQIIQINAWKSQTQFELFHFLEAYNELLKFELLITDINSDGALKGPNIKLYQDLIVRYPNIDLIASGGVSDLDDVKRLESIGVKKVVVGKALLENKITEKELEVFNAR